MTEDKVSIKDFLWRKGDQVTRQLTNKQKKREKSKKYAKLSVFREKCPTIEAENTISIQEISNISTITRKKLKNAVLEFEASIFGKYGHSPQLSQRK